MITWNNIETVLLDMDGTLLDLNFDNYFWREYLPEKWGELNGLDPNTARNKLMPRFQNQAGTLSWYCIDYWTENLDMDLFSLKMDLEHLIKPRPDAEEFLTYLRDLDKKIILVTNAHQKLIALKMKKTGIDIYFDKIFCAHNLGAPKEDIKFWNQLNSEFSFSKDTTVLIDDNLTVLRTARDYGIRYLLSIAKPDSQSPERDTEEFKAITSFTQLYN